MARAAQTPVDQADPSIVEEELRQDERARPKLKPTVTIAKPQAGTSNVGEAVLAGAIRVQGATALPPSAFARTIEPYVGRTLAPADLQALASDVADVARSAGFGLATAWVPQQRIGNGVLTVALDEGRIDGIEIEGNGGIVRRALAPLASGRPIRTAELERQLLLAGDIAGVRVRNARLDRRGGRSILVVTAVQKRIEARAYLDNWGSATIGPVRARLTVDFNGLFSGNDQLTVGGVLTPAQPSEFALVRAAYTIPVGTAGTEASFGGYFAKSQPGAALSGRDIAGRSVEVDASIRHPFVRSRAGSIWGASTFGFAIPARRATISRFATIAWRYSAPTSLPCSSFRAGACAAALPFRKGSTRSRQPGAETPSPPAPTRAAPSPSSKPGANSNRRSGGNSASTCRQRDKSPTVRSCPARKSAWAGVPSGAPGTIANFPAIAALPARSSFASTSRRCPGRSGWCSFTAMAMPARSPTIAAGSAAALSPRPAAASGSGCARGSRLPRGGVSAHRRFRSGRGPRSAHLLLARRPLLDLRESASAKDDQALSRRDDASRPLRPPAPAGHRLAALHRIDLELVIAQCKAGIVGSFPALNARPQALLDEWLHRITEELGEWDRANPGRPAAPFAVNQIVHRSNTRLEQDMAACAKWRVPIVITSLGAIAEVNQGVHQWGGLTLHDIINDRFARKAVSKGADGVIAVAAGPAGMPAASPRLPSSRRSANGSQAR